VNFRLRLIFFILMLCAMFFGFLHLFVEGGHTRNFERLHIFLFNLCSGGTIIIYYSAGGRRFNREPVLFLAMGILYTLFAFFEFYIPAVTVSLSMAVLVERARWKRFSPFPWNFFTPRGPISEKFHQSALLCLSLGLIISSLVILNNEYFKFISMKKLILNTFFLGFSFPVSLISLSVMFSYIGERTTKGMLVLKNACFWAVNLGVIIFFLFILIEIPVAQIMVTALLFISVIVIFVIFKRESGPTQEKVFLTSGMLFLVFTAISGISYIVTQYFFTSPVHDGAGNFSKILLKVHAFASLYGWNLSGLAVISRKDNFPIKLNLSWVIFLHWITVLILAPLGYYRQFFSVIAMISYALLLYHIFFSREKKKKGV